MKKGFNKQKGKPSIKGFPVIRVYSVMNIHL